MLATLHLGRLSTRPGVGVGVVEEGGVPVPPGEGLGGEGGRAGG